MPGPLILSFYFEHLLQRHLDKDVWDLKLVILLARQLSVYVVNQMLVAPRISIYFYPYFGQNNNNNI